MTTLIELVDNRQSFTKITLSNLKGMYESQYLIAKTLEVVNNRFEYIYKMFHPHYLIEVSDPHAKVLGELTVAVFSDILNRKRLTGNKAITTVFALHKLFEYSPKLAKAMLQSDQEDDEGMWFFLNFEGVHSAKTISDYNMITECLSRSETNRKIAQLYVDPSLFGGRETAKLIMQAIIEFSQTKD